jgi:hypothetical protein
LFADLCKEVVGELRKEVEYLKVRSPFDGVCYCVKMLFNSENDASLLYS